MLPQDLISLLKNRGLSFSDEQKAINYLTNIGYFRLSAYCYPLLDEPKTNHLYITTNYISTIEQQPSSKECFATRHPIMKS